MTDPAGDSAPSPATGDRLPTGAKVFLYLSGALLPLAIIASLATMRTTQLIDETTRTQARVAVTESGRKLAIELVGDMTALRVSLNALEVDPRDAPSCARAQGVFALQIADGTRFTIIDSRGRTICGQQLPKDIWPTGDMPIAGQIIPGHGLMLAMTSNRGTLRAATYFPAAVLDKVSKPSGYLLPYSAQLTLDGVILPITVLPSSSLLERRTTLAMPIGIANLTLQTQTINAPIGSAVLIAMLLPLLMWAAAAGIAWWVVDRLLIRPLRRLRASVAGFTPGEEIDAAAMRALPAREIRELGETFRGLSRTVADHEAGLAAGLVRQTRLTREVHHRVKNNLQVIASLINFHARAARSREASDAYASIQRRVDALAVVHRHHFAELEENRGLSLRAVIGELASNFRATAPDGSRLGIALDVTPFLVNQDVAIAVAFLLTEIIELAMTVDPSAQIRLSVASAHDNGDRAILRVNSPALIDGDGLRTLLAERYGRVIEGLSRQLRSALHHDPLIGAYEISIAVIGRD